MFKLQSLFTEHLDRWMSKITLCVCLHMRMSEITLCVCLHMRMSKITLCVCLYMRMSEITLCVCLHMRMSEITLCICLMFTHEKVLFVQCCSKKSLDKVSQQFDEIIERLVVQIIQRHCCLLITSVLCDAESHNWSDTKEFYEVQFSARFSG